MLDLWPSHPDEPNHRQVLETPMTAPTPRDGGRGGRAMTTLGAMRHFRRAVDVLMEKVWRELGVRRFLDWMTNR